MDYATPPAESIFWEHVVARNIQAALDEDMGPNKRDISSLFLADDLHGHGQVLAKENGILCGCAWFAGCFTALSEDVTIEWCVDEGDRIHANQLLCRLSGPIPILLAAERSALNFLQTLSAVATKTRTFVELVADNPARIVDTRKTLPGLRMAQKYAVTVGGGDNHRLGLWDAILIKENHIAGYGGIVPAMNAAKQAMQNNANLSFIEIEVETLAQLSTALACDVTMILLDNFTTDMLRQAVCLRDSIGSDCRVLLEASGNIDQTNVQTVAQTGVDRISIGGLTKHVHAIDLSMTITPVVGRDG